MEQYDHWLIVSECGALESAQKLKDSLTPMSKIVLSSEVAGSQALHTRRIDVVCGYSDQLIDLCDAQMCACSMIVAKSGFLTHAARRHCHDCTHREEIARAATARMILSLPNFDPQIVSGSCD